VNRNSIIKIMPPKKKRKNFKKKNRREKKSSRFTLPEETKIRIFGVAMFVIAILIAFSFFDLAGMAGNAFLKGFTFLIGKTVFVLPLIFILAGIIFFNLKYRQKWQVFLAIFILILGISGILASITEKQGGWLGYIISWPLISLFGSIATYLILGAIVFIGFLIIFQVLFKKQKEQPLEDLQPVSQKQSLVTKIVKKLKKEPEFKLKEIEPEIKVPALEKIPEELELKTKPISPKISTYKLPPLDLLEEDRGTPTFGDIKTNSTIIKRTLENFGIEVEMSEVNIGPTVTQYTLKPTEGIKLSRITSLSNDLSLALACHPIRIEAPIPGRSLVGIELPNKKRIKVRLKNLISNSVFQNSISNLTIILGRDVAGVPVFADISKMPHLLIAGSTGTGKTICLNNIILNLLYQNGPENLRFILIDPKRVEFSVYKGLPHLLCPIIFNGQKTVNALKWLIGEMERRFDVLSESKTRNIENYNQIMQNKGNSTLPYIILIIDELADLMAAKGREVEAGIVRLAQMARAVGIHLIVATQRPSVEVITGLIKANITSRITFQVASQVDSRTVLDMAGAEKLLGLGDLLFLSAETHKPKRIQCPYVSEKEVKKVMDYFKKQEAAIDSTESHEKRELEIRQEELAETLEKTLENDTAVDFMAGEDALYEEAKRLVIESRKASASLLQRRLRVGYARAARLIDMLEEKGVVGPADGAKPREVYIVTKDENEGWEKV
jgi:S-DNA-T family DNA segregation ATPase FtsK/SpoIIIE